MIFEQSRSTGRAARGPGQFVAIAGAALGVAVVVGWLMKRPGGLNRLLLGRNVPNAEDIFVKTAQQRPPDLAE